MMTDRTRELLTCWADWRGSSNNRRQIRQVIGLQPTAQSTLGRLVRMVRQGGELWEHNAPPPQYNEALMAQVDRIVQDMAPDARSAIFVEFVDLPYASQTKKGRRLGLSQRGYSHRISRALDLFEVQFPWKWAERQSLYE